MRLAALVESTDHVCCRYRLSAFGPGLAEAGHVLQFYQRPRGFWGRWSIGRGTELADAVILQRTLLSPAELGLLRRRVNKLIFDFDDAIWLRDSYSPKGVASMRRRRRFLALLRRCDAVIAGNSFLADHAAQWSSGIPVETIPTCVDVSRYHLARHDRPAGAAELVWIGSSSTLRGLEAIQPVLERIGERNRGENEGNYVRLKLICDRFLKLHNLPVVCTRWAEATEAAEIAEADIGISWVPDDPWSRGKCGLKVLQYMAGGLPVVANSVGVQAEMIRHGETGFLADTDYEWVDAIQTLAADPQLRRRMGEAGRSLVEEKYSVAKGSRSGSPCCSGSVLSGFRHEPGGPEIAFIDVGQAFQPAIGFGMNLADLPLQALDCEMIVVAGIRWHIAPAARNLLTPDSLDLDNHVKAGVSRLIKTGPHRTVHQVHANGLNIFWKHCRINGLRGWLRQCLRPPKAKMEFDRALALAARGIATVEPLAWGVRDGAYAGESFLITRELHGAVPLQSLLSESRFRSGETSAAPKQMLADRLGQFMAQLHEAGVTHPDLHPGNILVVPDEQGLPRFHLIDLHSIQLSPPLAWPQSRENLIIFNRWFAMRASRSERRRFWSSYALARKWSSPTVREQACEIERRTIRSNLRLWASRDDRCLGTNRYFRRVHSGFAAGFATRDMDEETLQRLLRDPDAPFQTPGNRVLKDSRTSTVVEITVPTAIGPRPMIWKRFRVKKFMAPLLNRLRRSPALRSWRCGHALLLRDLPTARPWLVLQRRGIAGPREGYLLCDKVECALELQDIVAECSCRARWSLIDRLARLIRRFHDAGLSHRDLKAANLLWSNRPDAEPGDEGSFHLIDLVGVRCHRRVSPSMRIRDLSRLNVSFLGGRHISRADKLGFFANLYVLGSERPGKLEGLVEEDR